MNHVNDPNARLVLAQVTQRIIALEKDPRAGNAFRQTYGALHTSAKIIRAYLHGAVTYDDLHGAFRALKGAHDGVSASAYSVYDNAHEGLQVGVETMILP